MNFPFPCPGCGHENHAEWALIGQQILCGWCGRPATVPAPMETVGAESGGGLPIRFACPACGRNFATKPSLAGQKVRCNRCGAGVRVPAGNSDPAGNVPRIVLNASSVSGQAVAAVAEAVAMAAPEVASPDAPAFREHLKEAGDPNRRRSAAVELPTRAETLEQVRQQEAEQEAAATQKKAEKEKRAKKKKRKKTGDFDPEETLTLVAGVSVVVGALAFLAWYFEDFRYPLGGLLVVFGFILYVLGAISLRRLAGRDSLFQLILYRFCPPYQLWFVLTRWQETKDYFAFFATGLIVMAIGGGVITTSRTFHKANRSEKEYQNLVREFVTGAPGKAPPPLVKPPADKGH